LLYHRNAYINTLFASCVLLIIFLIFGIVNPSKDGIIYFLMTFFIWSTAITISILFGIISMSKKQVIISGIVAYISLAIIIILLYNIVFPSIDTPRLFFMALIFSILNLVVCLVPVIAIVVIKKKTKE